MIRTLTAAAAIAFAGAHAQAGVFAHWVEVPFVHHAADANMPATPGPGHQWRVFDLYVNVANSGFVIFASDFGIAGPNTGVRTNKQVFHHPFNASNNRPDPTFVAAFPNLEWDTSVRMGSQPTGSIGIASPISMPGAPDPKPSAHGPFWNGAWFAQPVPPGNAGTPDANGDIWQARVTVASKGGFGDFTGINDNEYLGGQMFASFGFGDEAVIDVPNAFPVPTPGAVALFGLAGLAGLRRRR